MKLSVLRPLIAALCALCALSVTGAAAQAFPNRQVRITSPFPAGSGPDVVARMVAEKLAAAWKQPVLVDARPGANGFIAIDAVKRLPATGHELLLADVGHLAINPSLFRKLPYDPVNDLAPVSGVYRTAFFIAVAADGPIRSIPDLIAAARVRPDAVTYGSNAVGSPLHLGSAQLEAATGTRMLHAPYKELAQLYGAVVNREVTWAMASIASAGPLFTAGKLRFLAVADRARSPALPNVPTLEEAGGPKGVEATTWVVLMAPRGTPPEAAAQIQQAVAAALRQDDVGQRMRTFGFNPFFATPRELGDLIRADIPRYAEIVRASGASVD